ncbi:uncharacterized protein DS421_9g286910 [Arachis hypogaea]|nr:uncharacterized protein DS421_9g286910 [Arachis hypogaea]
MIIKSSTEKKWRTMASTLLQKRRTIVIVMMISTAFDLLVPQVLNPQSTVTTYKLAAISIGKVDLRMMQQRWIWKTDGGGKAYGGRG